MRDQLTRDAIDLLERVYTQIPATNLPISLRQDVERFVESNCAPSYVETLKRLRSGPTSLTNDAARAAVHPPSPVALVPESFAVNSINGGSNHVSNSSV